MKITIIRLLIALALLWPVVLAAEAAASKTPQVIAEQLDAALLNAMQNAKTLGYQGRYEALAPVLEESFDFPFMARVAVGRYWRKMTKTERVRLVDAFARLSIATFAARFKGYSGESFKIMGQEERPRGTILVLNRLTKGNGGTVDLNFLMREAKGRWRIVDVFLDAKFSELAIKRSEYTAVVKRDGVSGLIAIMEQKISNFATSAKS
jgi:phospholipid transport system substrate-binding protein